MKLPNEVAIFERCYPPIYLACRRRPVRDAVARRRLSRNQAGILEHLDPVAPTHLRSLARQMGVTPSTMSLNVDRLEAAGYVVRQRGRADARQIELRLSETGNRLKQQQTLLDPELVDALLQRLAESDRVRVLEGLQLLARAASEMAAAGPAV